MTTRKLYRTWERFSTWFEDLFIKVAFAEENELYPGRVWVERLEEVFARIAFAEAGEPYPETPGGNGNQGGKPKGHICIGGHTSSGLCA